MNKGKIGIIPLLLISFGIGFFFSCEDDMEVHPSLVTEDVLYVSGERARLLGRIITTQNVNALDHGFYIADNEEFSQPLVLSLGSKESPGRFIGETSGLDIEKTYYAKSYIELSDGLQFGNTLTLRTLGPETFDYSPANGAPGTIIVINGKNFTSDTRVLFGDNPGEVLDISFESRIRVRVPEIVDNPVVNLTVISQDKTMMLAVPYEYTIGKFARMGDFTASEKILDNIYFQQGPRFFVGLGAFRASGLNDKIWEYDFGSDTWLDTEFPGRPLFMSFASQSYFGSGAFDVSRVSQEAGRDFWKYEAGNYIRLPDLPFGETRSVAFEIRGDLYVAGGTLSSSLDIYKFDQAEQTWEKIKAAPFPIDNTMINFTYNDQQYFINPANRQLVKYDPGAETWETISTYPGELGNGSGIGIAVSDRVYIGLGNRSLQIWELNMNNLNWVRKNDYTGSPLARVVGVFTNDGLIYLLRSPEIHLTGPMEFWSFDPNGF